MRPLQAVALGLILIALEARFGPYDGLPDPVGWMLVLLGLRGLCRRTELGGRMGLWYLGALALLVSTVRWFPAAEAALEDADHALVWAADVPTLGFQALLCFELAKLAATAEDTRAATWLRLTGVGLALGLLAPVLYYGAQVAWLRGAGDLGLLLQLLVLALALWFSGRAWTGAEQVLPRAVRVQMAKEHERTAAEERTGDEGPDQDRSR